jgi:hypothetical protein
MGWVPPPVVLFPEKGIRSNGNVRIRLLELGWTADTSQVVCCKKGGHVRCTYKAYTSVFEEARDDDFIGVEIPTHVPKFLRGWYLWCAVGTYESTFPITQPFD